MNESFLSHVFIAADDATAVHEVFSTLGLVVLMGDPDEVETTYVRYGGGDGFPAGLESTQMTESAPGIELNIAVADAAEAYAALRAAGFDLPEPVAAEWGPKHSRFTVGGVHLAITEQSG